LPDRADDPRLFGCGKKPSRNRTAISGKFGVVGHLKPIVQSLTNADRKSEISPQAVGSSLE